MSKSKMCKGGESRRITVMTRPGDVIAGGSGGKCWLLWLFWLCWLLWLWWLSTLLWW
jgi:hypothetical protein